MTATPTVGSSESLGDTAARAVVWNYVSFASGKVLVLVTMAVLARLLTPADFGIVGYTTLVIAYLGVLMDLGFGAAPRTGATSCWLMRFSSAIGA